MWVGKILKTGARIYVFVVALPEEVIVVHVESRTIKNCRCFVTSGNPCMSSYSEPIGILVSMI